MAKPGLIVGDFFQNRRELRSIERGFFPAQYGLGGQGIPMPRLSDFKGAIILDQDGDLEPTSIVRVAHLERGSRSENHLYLRKIDGSYFAASVVFPDYTVLVAQEVEL